MVKDKSNRNGKIGVALGVSLGAFVAFALMTGALTVGVEQTLAADTYVTTEGAPALWSSVEGKYAVTTDVSAEILDNQLVQYTTYLQNTENKPLYLTHVAAYLNERGVQDGFAVAGGEAVQYSYTPEDANSWENLELAGPANSTEGFKLKVKLLLDVAGQKTDTIYLRYNVSPAQATGTMDDKLTFLVADVAGNEGVVKTESTLAYENLGTPEASAVADGGVIAVAEDEGYVRPLGVTDYLPETVTMSKVAAGTNLDKGLKMLKAGQWITVGIMGVLLIVLLAYMPKIRKEPKE